MPQNPAALLGRAVAVGHVLGAAAGARETDPSPEVIGERHRWHAVRGYLHEFDGSTCGPRSLTPAYHHVTTPAGEVDRIARERLPVHGAHERCRRCFRMS